MNIGDKYYCPLCGAEYRLDDCEQFDIEEFGHFDTRCGGCDRLFRTYKGEDGKLFTYA